VRTKYKTELWVKLLNRTRRIKLLLTILPSASVILACHYISLARKGITMSSSAATTQGKPFSDRTQRQLQDLDALLQKMLSLPTSDSPPTEPLPTDPPVSRTPEAPPPPTDVQPVVDSVKQTVTEALSQERAQIKLAAEIAPAAPAPHVRHDVLPEKLRSVSEETREKLLRIEAAARQETMLVRAAVKIDHAYEQAMQIFGPAGRPMTHRSTKNFLGWLGFVLLAAAGAMTLGAWLGQQW
jgi:hypothetical protein